MKRRRLLAGSGAVAAIVGTRPCLAAASGELKLADVPHVRAPAGFAGEAAAVSALRSQGYTLGLNDVFVAAGIDPSLGRGCRPVELDSAMTALGVDTGHVWQALSGAADDSATVRRSWRGVVAELRRHRPVVLYLGSGTADESSDPTYVVVTGASGGEVLYHDPRRVDGAWQRMSAASLLERWPTDGRDGSRGLVTLRMRPIAVEIPTMGSGIQPIAFARYTRQLRERIARRLSGRFLIVVEPPFVAVTDGTVDTVRRYVTGTVRWAVEHLRRDYFASDPSRVLEIWLFRSHESYVADTLRMFGEEPETPYGYFDPAHDALIMNIATGGGTLVHELVHPYMAENFPACPAWFDEGLASLYEESNEVDGKLVGLINWRLEGLQLAIRGNRVPSFRALTASGKRRFYSADPGTNYAQARYLCYYLQEQGKLRTFYHAFLRDHMADPTGYETLRAVLGVADMDAFKRRWERYVLSLSYP